MLNDGNVDTKLLDERQGDITGTVQVRKGLESKGIENNRVVVSVFDDN